jgi:hypothetical protein
VISALRLVRLGAITFLVCVLSLAFPVAEAAAPKPDAPRVRPATKGSGGAASQRPVIPRTGRFALPRSGRVTLPRSGRALAPGTNRFVAPPSRRITITRKRIVTPRDGVARRQTPVSAPRVTRPMIRKAPAASPAAINSGLTRNPGQTKPARIQHDPERKAGKSGWAHRHRPFFFKHAGHRWRRHYYSFLIGGLWYWYWYDLSADADPDVIIGADAALPDCDLESDECIEPEAALVAPAILEGGATQEDMARCSARFRSFNTETGTYVTYGGEVRICPYLE